MSSRPWVNGAADVVAASSGSTVDNTSGKYPFIYRGKENPYANAWVNVADLLHVREGTEGNYKYHMAYLPDPTKYAGGTVSSDYVQLDFEMPGQDGYVKELGKDPRYPFIRVTKTIGGSSSTYYADYYWYGRNAVNAVIAGGLVPSAAPLPRRARTGTAARVFLKIPDSRGLGAASPLSSSVFFFRFLIPNRDLVCSARGDCWRQPQ